MPWGLRGTLLKLGCEGWEPGRSLALSLVTDAGLRVPEHCYIRGSSRALRTHWHAPVFLMPSRMHSRATGTRGGRDAGQQDDRDAGGLGRRATGTQTDL